jgi:surface carbohydrate biosynthesis protein
VAITPQKKYLYIPLEIYKRELNGMLLLSLLAAKDGWRVMIGGKLTMFPLLSKLPEGVILLKSVVPGELSLQLKFKGMGHIISSIDAEGLIPSNGSSGVELRYSKETIAHSKALFFWGKDQYSQVRSIFSNIKNKAFITGSPIFDYWRFNKFANCKIEENIRKVILIATSFPYPNHYISKESANKSVRETSMPNASDNYFEEIGLDSKLQEYIYPKFFKLVEQIICHNPNTDVILRPHPAENADSWRVLSEKYNNVIFDTSDEISKRLIGCDIFIHFNSTASIEASYYGKTVLTYVPDNLPDKLNSRISRHTISASKVSNSTSEMLHDIEISLRGEKYKSDLELCNIVADSDSDFILQSSSNILKILDEICIKSHSKSFPSYLNIYLNRELLIITIKRRVAWFFGWIDYWTGLFSGRYKHSKDFYRYGESKQGKLTASELIDKSKEFIENTNLGNLKVSIKTIKTGLFLIDREL